MARRHREVVHPAAVAFVSRHHRCHERSVFRADQEQLRLHRELPRDVLARIIPRPRQAALFPERDNRGFVGQPERADLHRDQSTDRTAYMKIRPTSRTTSAPTSSSSNALRAEGRRARMAVTAAAVADGPGAIGTGTGTAGGAAPTSSGRASSCAWNFSLRSVTTPVESRMLPNTKHRKPIPQ